MTDSENLLQKAFYLGVGIAGLAVEKASDTFGEFKKQAEMLASHPDFSQKVQEIADEMVNKGKINTDEARKFVEQVIQQKAPLSEESTSSKAPRKIEIILDDEDE